MAIDKKDMISVIIPFYNDYKYITSSIRSVLNQTYENYEIIIVDDGSDNKAKIILKNIKNKDSRIKIFTHKKNLGAGAARNTGIKNARGKYITFLDSDDEWLKDKLSHQIKILKKKKINCLHSSYYSVDLNENIKGIFIAKKLYLNDLVKSCDIGLSTVILKKNLADENHFCNLSSKEDYIYWMDILKSEKFFYGDKKILTKYRIRDDSLSSSITKKFVNGFKVYNKYLKYDKLTSVKCLIRLSFFWFIKNIKSQVENKKIDKLKILSSVKNLDYKKSFSLVAFNLAALAYINKYFILGSNILFWSDGYMGTRFDSRLIKLPGRDIFKNLKLPKHIKNIYLCGNLTFSQKKFLKDRFKKKILFYKLPQFDKYNEINNLNLKFEDKSVIFINISTPKQEILSQKIFEAHSKKKLFIFCIGGAINILTNEEKIVPTFLYKLNLEWLWRLKHNTIFRSGRLLHTFLIYFFNLIIGKYSNIKFLMK